jgi:hypothetical protein
VYPFIAKAQIEQSLGQKVKRVIFCDIGNIVVDHGAEGDQCSDRRRPGPGVRSLEDCERIIANLRNEIRLDKFAKLCK